MRCLLLFRRLPEHLFRAVRLLHLVSVDTLFITFSLLVSSHIPSSQTFITFLLPVSASIPSSQTFTPAFHSRMARHEISQISDLKMSNPPGSQFVRVFIVSLHSYLISKHFWVLIASFYSSLICKYFLWFQASKLWILKYPHLPWEAPYIQLLKRPCKPQTAPSQLATYLPFTPLTHSQAYTEVIIHQLGKRSQSSSPQPDWNSFQPLSPPTSQGSCRRLTLQPLTGSPTR